MEGLQGDTDRMSRFRTFAAFALLGLTASSGHLLLACESATDGADSAEALRKKQDAGSDAGGLDFQACEQQHVGTNADGDAVIVCDKPFATAPHVHLPADDTKSNVATITVAYNLPLAALEMRDGTTLALMDAQGKAISFQDHGGSLPASLRMPSNRNMYSLYRLTGKLGQATPSYGTTKIPGFHVVSGAPVVMIPGDVLDGTMLGAWEGTTSARKPDGTFAPDDQVPIRVAFANLERTNNLKIWQTGTSLPDGRVSKLKGVIENFDRDVKASDGTCYKALTSLGDKNPFNGAHAGNVDAYRLGGMHFPGDQVLVFTVPAATSDWSMTAMGGLGPFEPGGWIANAGWPEVHLEPHGLPKGNSITLHLVTSDSGGGGGC
jgi:hypothetical protein